MDNEQALISIRDMSFGYDKTKRIFEGFSLDVNRGDRIGVLGPNGAGKTTLFLLIAGIEKPEEGSIRVAGNAVVAGKFQPHIGMVFQDSNDQIICPTVEEDIAFGPRNLGLSEREIRARVDQALAQLNIRHLKKRAPHHLSGGEKRLVTIAGSILAMNSRIAFYDEPASNLDAKYRRLLIEFIKGARQEAVMVSSHDLEFVLEVCNRVIIIDKGKVAADGRPREILSQSALLAQYSLEAPYVLSQTTVNPCQTVLSRG